MPWPISVRAMRMTTVSSGRITTHTPISGEPSAARTDLRAERQVDAEREASANRGGADHEGAAVHLRNVIHGCLPYAFAAAWIAARTCWKVPHRQMLVISRSMSASVGFGLFLSSSATAMIMPLWQ